MNCKYTERLFSEWKEYGNIIIAVDFDDTVSPWKLENENSAILNEVLSILKEAQYTGAYIVPFTTCKIDRYEEIKNFFLSRGIHVSYINKNPIPLPWGNESKVYANIYLDDRAGLEQSLQILKNALYKFRGYLQSTEMTDGVLGF